MSTISRVGLALAALGLWALWSGVAHAGAGDNVPVQDSLATVSLGATLTAFIAGAVVPLLVGIATKLQASGGVKVLIASLLNVAVAFIAQFIVATDGEFDLEPALLYLGIAVVTQVSTYYGVWKPTGVTARLAPNQGLG